MGLLAKTQSNTNTSLNAVEEAFVKKVYERGGELYRDFPWRNTTDAYEVLVSEVMLQQTQVARALRYWEAFIKLFPTIDALAAADTATVLEAWQGLGYNRRALMLKRCAEVCSREYAGTLPDNYDQLLDLPGIGKATAAGVLAFAYNQPSMYLETNVRTVFLHEFFPDTQGVTDKQLEPLVAKTCPENDARRWYYALLDYGAYLKSVLPNPSRRSAHHTQQSKYVGSRRQKRAELVRFALASERFTFAEACVCLSEFERSQKRNEPDPGLVQSILDDLVKEGFLANQRGRYLIP